MKLFGNIVNAINKATGTRLSVGTGANNSRNYAETSPPRTNQFIQTVANTAQTVGTTVLNNAVGQAITRASNSNGGRSVTDALGNIGSNVLTSTLLKTAQRFWYIPVILITTIIGLLVWKKKPTKKRVNYRR